MTEKIITLFKNPRGEANYMALYTECLKKWPLPYEEKIVPTSWGDTFVYVSGPEKAPPLVLLHAMSVSAVSWYPNLAALTTRRRVYAFCYPGDLGKSSFTNSPANPGEAADWFGEMCTALGIDKTDIAGTSFGAFLAANIAYRKKKRVKKVALISPVGVFSPICTQFYFRVISSMLLPFGFIRKSCLKWFHAPNSDLSSCVDELFSAGLLYGRPQIKFPPSAFRDEELRQLQVPLLLLLGQHEVLSKPEDTAERAMNLVPDIRIEIIPGAGHLLPIEQAETVNTYITDFLN